MRKATNEDFEKALNSIKRIPALYNSLKHDPNKLREMQIKAIKIDWVLAEIRKEKIEYPHLWNKTPLIINHNELRQFVEKHNYLFDEQSPYDPPLVGNLQDLLFDNFRRGLKSRAREFQLPRMFTADAYKNIKKLSKFSDADLEAMFNFSTSLNDKNAKKYDLGRLVRHVLSGTNGRNVMFFVHDAKTYINSENSNAKWYVLATALEACERAGTTNVFVRYLASISNSTRCDIKRAEKLRIYLRSSHFFEESLKETSKLNQPLMAKSK